jgi:hypothetical protein
VSEALKHNVSLSLILTIILLTSILLTTLPKVLTTTPTIKLVMSKDDWINLAKLAWNYYKPGVAVEYNTGLHNAGKLLVTLHGLSIQRREYIEDIEYIVNVRTNYTALTISNGWTLDLILYKLKRYIDFIFQIL